MFTPGFPATMVPARGEQGKVFDAPASTTLAYPLGTRMRDEQGREYIYCKALASTAIAAADACGLVALGATPITLTLSTAKGATGFAPVGISMVAVASSATAQYSWYCIYAPASALGSANCAATTDAFSQLYPHASAGVLDDATSNLCYVSGILRTTTATVAGINDAMIINYPQCGL